MSPKTLITLFVLIAILVVGRIVIGLRDRSESRRGSVPHTPIVSVPKTPAAGETPLVQKPVLTEQEKKVMLSFVQDESFREPGMVRYRVALFTHYPVYTASIAFRYDPGQVKFISAGAGAGPFITALPEDPKAWGVVVNRTVVGGTGLLGNGVFALVTFSRLHSASSQITLDLAESKVFLADGWGTKAQLELQ